MNKWQESGAKNKFFTNSEPDRDTDTVFVVTTLQLLVWTLLTDLTFTQLIAQTYYF